MAYRMQASVPDVMDSRTKPRRRFALYGKDSRTPGTFAANCLLARRLAERGVRFIQLYHQGWDQHGNLPRDIQTAVPRDRSGQRGAGHRSQAARPARRHARRLGRRVRPHQLLAGQADGHQLRPRSPPALLHHVDGRRRREARPASTARPTTSATTSPKAGVHVHDFHATLLHLLGIDHERLTYLLSGPPLPADRRARQGRHAALGVKAESHGQQSGSSKEGIRRIRERPGCYRRSNCGICQYVKPRQSHSIGP